MNREDVRRAFNKLAEKGDITDFERWFGARVTYKDLSGTVKGRQKVLAVLVRLKKVNVTDIQVRDMSSTQRNQRQGANTGFVVEAVVDKNRKISIIYDLWFSADDKLFAIETLSKM